jgi:hypothetical protein
MFDEIDFDASEVEDEMSMEADAWIEKMLS